jgi:hypothetical protein
MTSDFYFFDQHSRTSHIGRIHRSKRDSKDLNEALHQVKVALSIEDDDHSDHSSIPSKKQKNKQIGDIHLHTTSPQAKKPIITETLTKELDTILRSFDEKSKQTSTLSSRSKSCQITNEQDIDNENESMISTSNLPKISLPGLLIVALHSTWSDLIKNTDYKYKVKGHLFN